VREETSPKTPAERRTTEGAAERHIDGGIFADSLVSGSRRFVAATTSREVVGERALKRRRRPLGK